MLRSGGSRPRGGEGREVAAIPGRAPAFVIEQKVKTLQSAESILIYRLDVYWSSGGLTRIMSLSVLALWAHRCGC